MSGPAHIARQYEVVDANTGAMIEDGFATIGDALDASERIDPDESRGVFARQAVVVRMAPAIAAA